MICASAVPITARASTDPLSFQPGICEGSCHSPNGSSTTKPPIIVLAASVRPLVCATRRWPQRLPTAYATDAITTASVPAAPHQPPSGWMPASTPTPTSPTMKPASRRPWTRSLGFQRIASSTTKIGIEAFAIAATPESMCFSPQAISVNGIAPFTTPRAKPSQPTRRRSATDARQPRCAARTTRITAAAIPSRTIIIVAGSKALFATLMNMYEAPQNAASSPM